MTTTSGLPAADPSGGLHQAAVEKLRKRRELQAHVSAYLLVNTFLIIWWLITPGGFFWPMFPMFG